jgi:hypothetical protein
MCRRRRKMKWRRESLQREVRKRRRRRDISWCNSQSKR